MFRFTTAGESHGRALVAIVEGLPAGLPVDVEAINRELEQAAVGLWPRRAHEDRARPRGDSERRAPRPDARLAGRIADRK